MPARCRKFRWAVLTLLLLMVSLGGAFFDVLYLNSPRMQAQFRFGIRVPVDVDIVKWNVDENVGPDLEFVPKVPQEPSETINEFWGMNPPPNTRGVFMANKHFCSWRTDDEEWRLDYLPNKNRFRYQIIFDK